MDELVIGLYVLSLVACCVCLWLWYEIDSTRDHMRAIHLRAAGLEQRVEELERKRR